MDSSGAVFDRAAVRAARTKLFGGAPPDPVPPPQFDRFGTSYRHCGACPKADGEPCGVSCTSNREALEKTDGVKVTWPT